MPKTKEAKQPTVTKQKLPQYYQAIGRRKTATARVRLFPINKDKVLIGSNTLIKDQIIVNNKSIQEYFKGKIFEKLYYSPFRITDSMGRFGATIKVEGSGLYGQLDSVIHGISRALVQVDKVNFRPLLKKAGYLTRDPREKERRKAGLAGKARAGKQSPKR